MKNKPSISARNQRKKEDRRKEAKEDDAENGIAGGLKGVDRDRGRAGENDEGDNGAERVGAKWKKTKYMRRHRYGTI